MTYNKMYEDDLHRSFRAYEKQLEEEVKLGKVDTEQAYRLLKSARKNYKDKTYNKYVDKIDAIRDTRR